MSRLSPCINCGSEDQMETEQTLFPSNCSVSCRSCGWHIKLKGLTPSRQDIEAMWNRLWDMQQTAEQVHKLGVDLQGEAMKTILKDMED